MKTKMYCIIFGVAAVSFIISCSQTGTDTSSPQSNDDATVSVNSETGGQMDVNDDESAANVVKIAVGSKDHSTLVAAVKAADLVNVLSNNGPFTVFAPTNAAFDALPAGTVDGLLKPESKEALSDILQYHVFVGVLNNDLLKDGQVIEMVNGGMATIHMKDGKYMINDANIVGSVPASNGIVHVIDKVILPPAK